MIATRLARLSNREKIWTGLAIAVALGVAGHFLVYRPVLAAFVRLDDAIVSEETAMARNLRVLAPHVRKGVEEQYRQYGERVAKRMSTAEENATMLVEIEALANRFGVNLLSTKPRAPRSDVHFEEYAVDIEAEAPMSALIGFLGGLESSPQLLRVERLSLEPASGSGGAALKERLLVTKVVTL